MNWKEQITENKTNSLQKGELENNQQADSKTLTLQDKINKYKNIMEMTASKVVELNNEKFKLRKLAVQEHAKNNPYEEPPEMFEAHNYVSNVPKENFVVSKKEKDMDQKVELLDNQAVKEVEIHKSFMDKLKTLMMENKADLNNSDMPKKRELLKTLHQANIRQRYIESLDGKLLLKNPMVYASPSGNPIRDHAGTVADVSLTMAGMPFVAGLVSGAINTVANYEDPKEFGKSFMIGTAASFAGGSVAGKIVNNTGLSPEAFSTAILRGGLSGAISSAANASLSGEDVSKGVLRGAVTGTINSGAYWKFRDDMTTKFIKENVFFSPGYTVEQSISLQKAIREAGQSPIGARMFSKFRNSKEKLYLSPERESYAPNIGPHVVTGTNSMYFNGEFDKSPLKKYLPDATDGVVFTHELGHTRTGYNVRDPINVAITENRFRNWNGLKSRPNYSSKYDLPINPGRAITMW